MKPLIYQNKLREKEGVPIVVKIILGEPPQSRGVSITGFDKSVNTAQAASQVADKVKGLGLAGE